MTVDFVAYLDSIGPDLLRHLDDDHGLGLGTAEDVYRYGVALLQGRTLAEQVAKEWEDFFPLAGAFVLAYGSERLALQNRKAALLATGRAQAPHPLTGGGPVLAGRPLARGERLRRRLPEQRAATAQPPRPLGSTRDESPEPEQEGRSHRVAPRGGRAPGRRGRHRLGRREYEGGHDPDDPRRWLRRYPVRGSFPWPLSGLLAVILLALFGAAAGSTAWHPSQ